MRDPLGYVDGMSLFEYVNSCTISGIDPEGLRDLSAQERLSVCARIQQRYDLGEISEHDYQSARKNFSCDGIGLVEDISRELRSIFEEIGGEYGFVDCLADCIDENSSMLATIIMLAGNASTNAIPAYKTKNWRNLNPVPRKFRKGFGGSGRPENTTNWQNLWKKLPKELQAKFPLKWLKTIGRASVVLTLVEGGYMAAIEAYCVGHCGGLALEGTPRYCSQKEIRDKLRGS